MSKIANLSEIERLVFNSIVKYHIKNGHRIPIKFTADVIMNEIGIENYYTDELKTALQNLKDKEILKENSDGTYLLKETYFRAYVSKEVSKNYEFKLTS